MTSIILFPILGSFFVFSNFILNQNEIAKTICVQKRNVFNNCNGRCELQKSIKKFENNQQEMNNHLKEKLELVYILSPSFLETEFFSTSITRKNNSLIIPKKPISVVLFNFRPPTTLI